MVKLAAVGWWPHGQMTQLVSTEKPIAEATEILRQLGWIYFGPSDEDPLPETGGVVACVYVFNYSGSMDRGYIYDLKGFAAAVEQAVKALNGTVLSA